MERCEGDERSGTPDMRVQWILMSEERDRTLAIAGWNADEHFRPPGSAVLNRKFAGVAQLVERQPSKLDVAGSNPVARSICLKEPFSEYGAAWARSGPR